jgi:hypothetical protein
MRKKGTFSRDAALMDCWRRWRAIVEQFALEMPDRKKVEEEAYRKLYGELLAHCQTLAEWEEGPNRTLYQKLDYLARPWLNPDTFERAEQEILTDLLKRCQQAEQELTGVKARLTPGWWILCLVGVVMVVASYGVVQWAQGRWLSIWEKTQRWAESIRAVGRGLNSTELGLLVAGGLVVVAMLMMWRSGRT